jgi:hypothetical protein
MTHRPITHKTGSTERRVILAGLRGALAGGPSLTVALEHDRKLEREREECKCVELRPDRRS